MIARSSNVTFELLVNASSKNQDGGRKNMYVWARILVKRIPPRFRDRKKLVIRALRLLNP